MFLSRRAGERHNLIHHVHFKSVHIGNVSLLSVRSPKWNRFPRVAEWAAGSDVMKKRLQRRGNTGGTDRTTRLPVHRHTCAHTWARPVPALQPSTLGGALKLKTHSWRMDHIFPSVCFSGSISINVEQKCSYGTGSGWNPLFLPLCTHSHTHVEAEAQQRNSSPFQHGTMAWKRCGTWSFSRKWHTGTHCPVHSLVWACVLMCPLCAAGARPWWQRRQQWSVRLCAVTAECQGVSCPAA